MSRTGSPGRFLVFEGLDGAGKSTLIQAVKTEVQRRGHGLVLSREPGGTPLAEDIRKLLLRTDHEAPVPATELLLYAASRAQHVAIVIKPALEKGEWVLCDRFTASSVAFQCFARGLSRPDTDWLNTFAKQGAEPDLTILLDLTVAESRRRQGGADRQREADRMERENETFHENVRRGYLEQAKESPSSWLVLDAGEKPDVLARQVIEALEARKWLA